MTFLDAVQQAFEDELEKIAYVRMGRKPISIDRMLERETEVSSPSDALGLSDDPEVIEEEPKVASAGASKAGTLLGKIPKKDAALLAGGALAYHQGRKVNRRYQLGKQIELQNQGY